MRFDNAQSAESVVWAMRLADWPRSLNRAQINELFDGLPPYTDEEKTQNRITTNVNFLEPVNVAHSARRQWHNGLMTPDPLFTVDVDCGAPWQRQEYSQKVTSGLKRILKRSLTWYEMRRSVFAAAVLHGIGPSHWVDDQRWCGSPLGPEDVLMPGQTLLTFENLPFFCIFKQFTANKLWEMTHGPYVDKGWNVPLAEKLVAWAEDQCRKMMGAAWPEFWSPEKMEARIKSDSALYASDSVPTICCYDLYFWDDSHKQAGWRRRIVLDAWGDPGAGVGGIGGIQRDSFLSDMDAKRVPSKSAYGTRGDFLYDSGDEIYADDISKVIHFQFADASCVAPFRYHSVRSLGFLLYSVCHLQNRLRCKFNDAVFESLLQYFRVANPIDAERLTQVDLIDKGIIPEGLFFVKQEERWKVDLALAQTALQLNRQTMSDNSVSFTQDFDFAEERHRTETATRTMAKVNASAAMVAAMLSQAYKYEEARYIETCRRFCVPNSKDKDVREFRLMVLKQGVPEEALDVNRWDISAVRIMGSGNKEQQVAIAEAMMRIRPLLGPEAQKLVDRLYIAAYTEDYALAEQLVPDVKAVSTSTELGQFAAATLFQGFPVDVKSGINLTEYIEALLVALGAKVQQTEAQGGMASAESIAGMAAIGAHIQEQIAKLAEDKNEKQRVKQYGDVLGNLMNMVKAYTQRLQEAMQQQAQAQGGGQGQDPEAAAKAQATVEASRLKDQLRAESHAQRTAERQVQFERKLQQDEQRHAADMRKQFEQTQMDLAKQGAETAIASRPPEKAESE